VKSAPSVARPTGASTELVSAGVGQFLSRAASLRSGEAEVALPAMASLFLMVAAHTILETARDAVFLARFPPRDLNLLYVALAVVTIITAFGSAKLTRLLGRRAALLSALIAVTVGTVPFAVIPASRRMAIALYLWSGVEGAMLVPQFWLLLDDLFTVTQARRLFGPITSGGVLGGILGAGSAALLVRTFPVTTLLPFAGLLFGASACVVGLTRVEPAPRDESVGVREPRATSDDGSAGALFRETPFLFRIAALVGLSTAAVLAVDYLFKSAAARSVPAESLGYFFARYYAVMNAASLVVQVFVVPRVVRRLGVIGASGITPVVLLAASVGVSLQGGFFAVLVLKTCDGGLRYSLHRVATELLYLPVPASARLKIKTFIDGALGKTVQAATAVGLYVLALRSISSPRILGAIVVVLCSGWLAIAATLRRSYLDLFRSALASGGIESTPEVEDIDMTSAAALVEAMASPEPATVASAMGVLAEHQRSALIPALILYHDDPKVLTLALGLFSESSRTDWIPLAKRLLGHANAFVGAASAGALMRAGRLEDIETAAEHSSPGVQGYVAFVRASRDGGSFSTHPLVESVMRAPGEKGRILRLALLAAIADASDPRAVDLLLEIAALPEMASDPDAIERVAAAASSLKSERFIPFCLERLTRRIGRDAIRDALVSIGEPAFEALEALLGDETADRKRRFHAPRTLSRFGSQRAADALMSRLFKEPHGSIRYKVLRALGQLVAGHDVRVDRVGVEREAVRNLVEYLRLLALRVALESEAGEGTLAKRVLLGLLSDKLNQSMERAFRLVQIAHKGEDIEAVHAAARSSDKSHRANALEFLDVLLVREDEQVLRRLLRIVVDDADDRERVRRARREVPALATTFKEALFTLLDERDDTMVALAAEDALSRNDPAYIAAVDRARVRCPTLDSLSDSLFGKPLGVSPPR
jgi:ATP:ADP antiporter, AAA family